MFDFLKIGRGRRLRVVCNGNAALRNVSMPVFEINDEVRMLAERMIVTMKENEIPGVGLAAPQVGVNVRMIVIDTRPTKKDKKKHVVLSPGEQLLNPKMPMALINPEILSSSAETETACEGCLSLSGVEGDVTRPARVLLSAKTIDGEDVLTECGGLLARCLQHEIDHLNGILFFDRLPNEQKAENQEVMLALAEQEKLLAKAEAK